MKLEDLSEYLDSVSKNPLFTCDISKSGLGELVQIRSAIKGIEEIIKIRMDAIRANIISNSKSGTSKGTESITTEAGEVSIMTVVDKIPSPEKFKSLLIEKGIPVESGMDTRVELMPSPSKIDFLIKTGKITDEEVNELRGVEKRVKTNPSSDVKETIQKSLWSKI